MTAPIKIAFFITNSDLGGAQVHVLQVCEHLPAEYEAVVIAGGRDRLFEKLDAAKIRHLSLPALANSFSLKQTWTALQQLRQVLRDEQPALIHAHSAKAGAMARLMGWWLKIPVVYTVHGFGFKPAAPFLKRQALFTIEWVLAPLTRMMLCVAHSEALMAKRLPISPSRVRVIHNGIPDTAERSNPAAQPCAAVMVARFAAPKRQDLLLEAFTRLQASGQCLDAKLSLAGTGKQLADLQSRYASPHVHFLGEVDTIPRLLAQHGLFVLTSDHEGLPLSIIEAMRAGMAIIATDLPGIRELMTHQVHGWLVPAGDVAAISNALQTLLSDAALRSKLGHAARQRYETEFGLAMMLQKITAAYQSVLPTSQQVIA